MKKKLNCPKPDATRHHAVLLTLETFLAITETPAHKRRGHREKPSFRANAAVSASAAYAGLTTARR